MTSRGVVLEIYFDGAKTAAVICPLADFFGDGCGGESMYFSSKFIECAPWSYNCYFPMPFKESARVVLRNDTDKTSWTTASWNGKTCPSGTIGSATSTPPTGESASS